MRQFVADPWQARNEYIHVILEQDAGECGKLFVRTKPAVSSSADEKTKMLKLLEMQRHAMLMFTSCGWFFDDISGIEGIQVMKYAARAMQLAARQAAPSLKAAIRRFSKRRPATNRTSKTAQWLTKRMCSRRRSICISVGAHYAVSSLFGEYPTSGHIYCYSALSESFERFEAGTQSLVIGRVRLHSNITWEDHFIDFAVLHLGEHNLYGGVAARMDDDVFAAMNSQIRDSFERSDISAVIRLMNQYFGTHNYSLWYLFKDEQRRIVTQILQTSLREIEVSFRHIYEHHYPLMQAMKEMRMPLPRELSAPAEFIITGDFVEELEKEDFDVGRLQTLADEVKKWSFHLSQDNAEFCCRQKNKFADEKTL